jgi:hypothetical protein
MECDPIIDSGLSFNQDFSKDCLINGVPEWCVISLLMWACMAIIMAVFTMKWNRSEAVDTRMIKGLLQADHENNDSSHQPEHANSAAPIVSYDNAS